MIKIRHAGREELFAQVEQKFQIEGVDLSRVFACGELVFTWDPAKKTASPEMIDNDRENAIIILYLREHGRVFQTLEEAVAYFTSFDAQ